MYDIFMIDPPWPKKKGGKRIVRPNQGRDLDYNTMSVFDIFQLLDDKIFNTAKKIHTVFMWTTEQFLFDCEKEMESRKYKRHIRMIWDKGNGIAPAFTIRFSHEYLIWFYKPKMIKISENMRGKICSVFRENSREHSRKPEIAYNIIDSWFPNEFHSKIDVFSREKRNGWDQFGDQINYFKNIQQIKILRR